MRVFKVSDCDWYIGESLESCIAEYKNVTGDEPEEAYELTDEQLDTEMLDNEDDEVVRTFRQQLEIEKDFGGKFPRFFASTEC